MRTAKTLLSAALASGLLLLGPSRLSPARAGGAQPETSAGPQHTPQEQRFLTQAALLEFAIVAVELAQCRREVAALGSATRAVERLDFEGDVGLSRTFSLRGFRWRGGHFDRCRLALDRLGLRRCALGRRRLAGWSAGRDRRGRRGD